MPTLFYTPPQQPLKTILTRPPLTPTSPPSPEENNIWRELLVSGNAVRFGIIALVVIFWGIAAIGIYIVINSRYP